MRILLVTPSTFGYESRIYEGFVRSGHHVEWMDERIGNSSFIKVVTRLNLLQLVPSLLRGIVMRLVEAVRVHELDRIIVINPETLRGRQFALLKSELPDTDIIIYRWDSLSQKPLDDLSFEAATVVFSFDPADCTADNRLRHLPLFHDHREPPSPEKFNEVDFKYKLSFIGTAQLRRLRVLGSLCKLLDEKEQPYFFYLKSQSSIHQFFFYIAALITGYKGLLSRSAIRYDDLMVINSQAEAVVDIEFSGQSGLTMRTFEVLFSGKHLLTTNANVRLYDFAGGHSVTVFDDNAPAMPVIKQGLDEKIVEKFDQYSLDHWIHTLTGMKEGGYFDSHKPRIN